MELPDEVQIGADVHKALIDAITANFDIARDKIKDDTVPSDDPMGFDAQGWGICLATFAENLGEWPDYSFYQHRPAYTEATLDEEMLAIEAYLTKAVIDQSQGL